LISELQLGETVEFLLHDELILSLQKSDCDHHTLVCSNTMMTSHMSWVTVVTQEGQGL